MNHQSITAKPTYFKNYIDNNLMGWCMAMHRPLCTLVLCNVKYNVKLSHYIEHHHYFSLKNLYVSILWRILLVTICTSHTSKLRKTYLRNSKLLFSRWLYVSDLNVLGQSPRHNMWLLQYIL